jgi:hypothetical protein
MNEWTHVYMYVLYMCIEISNVLPDVCMYVMYYLIYVSM